MSCSGPDGKDNGCSGVPPINPFQSVIKEKVFHGTNAEFDRFDERFLGSRTDPGFLGIGFYFSTDERVPSSSKYRLEVFLKVKKPLVLQMTSFRQLKRELVTEALGLERTASPAEITAEAKRRGHDGVILDYSPTGYISQEILVFSSDQIQIVSRTPTGR